jgi:hypothetical protein
MFRDVLLDMTFPGRCSGIESVRAGYVIGTVQATLFVLGSVNGGAWWPLLTVGVGLMLPQLFLHIGIVWAKVRELMPPPAGHAVMFQAVPPLIGVGWIKSIGGLLISIAAFAAGFALSHAT